jgi:hypothetical protein
MPLIVRLDRDPRPADIEMLRLFEESGIAVDMALHGGVPRNIALNMEDKIRDYDIWGSFGSGLDPFSATLPQTMIQRIAALPHVSDVRMTAYDPPNMDDGKAETGIKFELTWRGRKLDLLIDNLNWPISKKIHSADAPINAVAMNSGGETWAHPDHADHLARRIYEPIPGNIRFDGRAAERFEILSRKIEGLTTSDPRCKPQAQGADCGL